MLGAAWLIRAGTLSWPAWPDVTDPRGLARTWGWMVGGLLLALTGMVLLVALDSRFVHRTLLRARDSAPGVRRLPVDPSARSFVYCFALAPALTGSVIASMR